MVERFHRQLKASLRAAADPENWTDHLPLVLLGIRSALKPDLDCSAAELVFGATVRLPGEMISPTPQSAVEDPTNLLHRLRQFMRTLSPVPPRSSASPSHLEKDLATCSHVYLRCDRVRRPLEPPYDGPFRVISRGTKNFRIQRGTREEVVSVDRLKAAVPDTPPDEPCGPLPSAPPPRPSIPPSRILSLPPCPPPTTPTTPSSISNTTPTAPSAPLRATFGLAGGYCAEAPDYLAFPYLFPILELTACLTEWKEHNSTRRSLHELDCQEDRTCEARYLRDQFVQNGYPKAFISRCLRGRHQRTRTSTPPTIWHSLPYIKGGSEATERIAAELGVGIAHRPKATMRNRVMKIKDRLKPEEQSDVVYRIPCQNCPCNYTGRTGRMLGSRIHEHKPAVRRGDALSQVDEMGHEFNFAATKIVAHAGNKTGRELIEAWVSDENSVNRFIDLAPAYRALRSHLQSCAVG
ncbi:hypothetical protein SprV_0301345400 [Sparganum proliferum]